MENIQAPEEVTKKKGGLNAATFVTLVRIALMPLIIFFYLSSFDGGKLIALILFVFAAATDFLDGWIARRFNQVTDMGKLLDPIADKLLTFLGFLLIFSDVTLLGTLYPIWVAISVFFIATARDYVINAVRKLAALKNKVLAATWHGKVKSAVQYVAISLAMFYAYYLNFMEVGDAFEVGLRISVWVGLGLATLLTVFSGASFILQYRRKG